MELLCEHWRLKELDVDFKEAMNMEQWRKDRAWRKLQKARD